MSWLSTQWHLLQAWFSKEEQEVLPFFKGAAQQIVKNGGAVLLDAATAAVVAAEASGKSGAQKFADAIAAATSVLEKEGIPVVSSAVMTAVQAAVSNLKSDVSSPS